MSSTRARAGHVGLADRYSINRRIRAHASVCMERSQTCRSEKTFLHFLKGEETGMNRKVELLIKQIETDFNRNASLTLKDLAQNVKLSIPHLRRIFKAETGESFAHYHKALRMRKAKELLATTFLGVKQIALKTGFGDVSHFVRDFKKDCGMTPTQYRNHQLDAGMSDNEQIG